MTFHVERVVGGAGQGRSVRKLQLNQLLGFMAAGADDGVNAVRYTDLVPEMEVFHWDRPLWRSYGGPRDEA